MNPKQDFIFKLNDSVVIKSEPAKEVLQLLDSDEDAPDDFSDIVEAVAKKAGICTETLRKELELYI